MPDRAPDPPGTGPLLKKCALVRLVLGKAARADVPRSYPGRACCSSGTAAAGLIAHPHAVHGLPDCGRMAGRRLPRCRYAAGEAVAAVCAFLPCALYSLGESRTPDPC